MTYFTCLEDVAEDVEVMLFRFIGEEHPRDKHDDIESFRDVDDEVALYVTNLCKKYDALQDRNVIDRMTYYLSPSLGDDEEDSPPHALGLMLKLARTKFVSDLNMIPLTFDQVFKWFMNNSQRMKDDGIASTEAMEAAYRVYWTEQYDVIMKEIKRLAMKWDNEDDDGYAMEARQDFEDSGGW